MWATTTWPTNVTFALTGRTDGTDGDMLELLAVAGEKINACRATGRTVAPGPTPREVRGCVCPDLDEQRVLPAVQCGGVGPMRHAPLCPARTSDAGGLPRFSARHCWRSAPICPQTAGDAVPWLRPRCHCRVWSGSMAGVGAGGSRQHMCRMRLPMLQPQNRTGSGFDSADPAPVARRPRTYHAEVVAACC